MDPLTEDTRIDCLGCDCGGFWLVFMTYWHLVQAWKSDCWQGPKQREEYAYNLLAIMDESYKHIEAAQIWNYLHKHHTGLLAK